MLEADALGLRDEEGDCSGVIWLGVSYCWGEAGEFCRERTARQRKRRIEIGDEEAELLRGRIDFSQLNFIHPKSNWLI